METFAIIQFVAKVSAWGLWVASFCVPDDSKWSTPLLVAAVMTSVVACSDL
jgi:hypothetical protein